MLQSTFSIDITENGIILNRQLFEFPFLLANLVHLFGEPSRIYEGEPNDDRGFYWNSKQVWDELGISTISDKAAETLDVVELEIQLSKKRQFDHMPKHPFSGKVTFNHKKIEELVVITNQYYPYPYKNLNFKDIVARISLIRSKKVNEISCITIYKEKK